MIKRNPSLKQNAQNLRRNMTKEERKLWYDFLRDYPAQFRRQLVIGNYIVDFYCEKAKLVVELDGSQHYEPEGVEADARRTQYLQSLGLCVLRFSNGDVNRNFRGVCEAIDFYVTSAKKQTSSSDRSAGAKRLASPREKPRASRR